MMLVNTQYQAAVGQIICSEEHSMKHYKILPLFALMLGIGVPLLNPAIAAEPRASSAMSNYIQNARTPEDHEHIASLFDLQAARAQSIADGYARQFECQHLETTTLQRRGVRFPGATARRYCRQMLLRYTNEATQNRDHADYHRRVAEHWRAKLH
jgi:hypothetical protein